MHRSIPTTPHTPQTTEKIVINHRRRTTVGLSLDFELLNLLGFAAYTAFASAFYGSGPIQRAYADRHGGNESKVTVQDVFFAVSGYPAE
jgi:cystinosin